MATEAGHIQISEFSRDVIPQINWMMEDLFCQYGVSIPYFMLDYEFPDYSQRPDWVTYSPPKWYLPEWKAQWPDWTGTQWPDWLPTNGFSFGSDWGPWGYWLTWFNELLGLLSDEAGLPRWQMPDLSPASWVMFNSKVDELYVKASWTYISRESGVYTSTRAGYGSSYASAKTDYEDDPTYSTPGGGPSRDATLDWYTNYIPGWPLGDYRIAGTSSYLKFDTSSVSQVSGAKIVLTGIGINEENNDDPKDAILQIYEHDYNEPWGAGDWTGGTKIAEVELIAGDVPMNVDIGNDNVNMGGYSKYRFVLKCTTDLDYWDTAADADDSRDLGVAITQIQLALR